jgi:1,2-diacylglycerol 3-beta-galactosyltransferase
MSRFLPMPHAKKQILILMSHTGGGHASVAKAIQEEFERTHAEDVQISQVDYLADYASFPFYLSIPAYPFLINHAPWIWRLLYKLTDHSGNTNLINRIGMSLSTRGYQALFTKYQPHVLISVHPFANASFTYAKHRFGHHHIPLFTVVTDLVSIHSAWADPACDACFVATSQAHDTLVSLGVPAAKTFVTGLPVDSSFTRHESNPAAVQKNLGISGNLPLVLLLAGAIGIEKTATIAYAIDQSALACQLAIVAGKNERMEQHLREHAWHKPAHIYGFVSNVADLMSISSMVVTKAGPSSVTEAALIGLPMILFDAVPGQEDGNRDYVVANHAGVWAPSARLVVDSLSKWLNNEQLLRQTRENAKKLARPDAARLIVEKIWRQLQ